MIRELERVKLTSSESEGGSPSDVGGLDGKGKGGLRVFVELRIAYAGEFKTCCNTDCSFDDIVNPMRAVVYKGEGRRGGEELFREKAFQSSSKGCRT